MSPADIRRILQERGLRPLKQFGQNFLHDKNLIEWVIREISSGVPHGEKVVEIGPGLGSLTRGLLESGYRVLAIEKDRGLAAYLRETLGGIRELELLEGDALDHIPPQGNPISYLVGNLPYNISSRLLTGWLLVEPPPAFLFFLLQKEMAERLQASVDTPEYGSLSVLVQVDYKVELLKTVPASVFYPAPEVESAFIRLIHRQRRRLEPNERIPFETFLRKGFSQRRKKLSNVLPISDSRRPGEVDVEGWIALFRHSNELGGAKKKE